MHKARAFLYICAGIFLLALAYHVGARSATAQADQTVAGANMETSGGYTYFTAAVGRTFYYMSNVSYVPHPIPEPIPGSSPVVATQASEQRTGVLLANGDVYDWTGQWTRRGNLFAGLGPTSATRETWGGVKARYRPGASATPQDK